MNALFAMMDAQKALLEMIYAPYFAMFDALTEAAVKQIK